MIFLCWLATCTLAPYVTLHVTLPVQCRGRYCNGHAIMDAVVRQ